MRWIRVIVCKIYFSFVALKKFVYDFLKMKAHLLHSCLLTEKNYSFLSVLQNPLWLFALWTTQIHMELESGLCLFFFLNTGSKDSGKYLELLNIPLEPHSSISTRMCFSVLLKLAVIFKCLYNLGTLITTASSQLVVKTGLPRSSIARTETSWRRLWNNNHSTESYFIHNQEKGAG